MTIQRDKFCYSHPTNEKRDSYWLTCLISLGNNSRDEIQTQLCLASMPKFFSILIYKPIQISPSANVQLAWRIQKWNASTTIILSRVPRYLLSFQIVSVHFWDRREFRCHLLPSKSVSGHCCATCIFSTCLFKLLLKMQNTPPHEPKFT